MNKKKYITPEITVLEMESSQIMTVSGWTPDGDKNGFGIVEEEDDYYEDNDF